MQRATASIGCWTFRATYGLILGKPRGSLAEGVARVLPAAESQQAYELIRGNWSPAMWPSEMAMDGVGVSVVYIEICAARASAET